MVRLAMNLAVLLLMIVTTSAAAEPLVHVVARGQRLGSIAKRYNVNIEAICTANGIRRRDLLRPGQRLVIPDRSDTDGRAARSRAESTPSAPPDGDAEPAKPPAEDSATKYLPAGTHIVARGQRLGSIAKRYRVSIEALCQANGIRRSDRIHPGQKLVIPGTARSSASAAPSAAEAVTGSAGRGLKRDRFRAKRPEPSWARYSQRPRRRGYVTLVGYHGQWSGYLVGKGRRVLPAARRGISQVLAWPRTKTLMDTRLLQLLAQVSDQFGGRPIRLVSGWRNTSFARESRHKRGRAMDFSIPGVPNEILRDYLHTLHNVGVGYYPNSTFVHLDSRDVSAFWTDYAGPGEPPRYRPVATAMPAHDEVANADTDGTTAEATTSDAQTAGTQTAGTQTADTQAADTQAADTQAANAEAVDAKSADSRSAEATGSAAEQRPQARKTQRAPASASAAQ